MSPRRTESLLSPAAWLVADAALAATLAGPAETLLLFLVSPDRPLTLRDFLATLVALAPQIVFVFVLLGPLLVVAGMLLSVGRSTTRGISPRLVLRFAAFDGLLLTAAAMWQWISLGPVLPEPGRTALGLVTTAILLATLLFLSLTVRDARRPIRSLTPWLLAIATGLVVALSVASDLRRDRWVAPRPIELPGFVPARSLLVVELPGLGPTRLERYRERGEVPAIDGLAREGFVSEIEGAPAEDTLAMHATLITGVGPERHGVLRSVRYRPRGDRRSFAVLPRGLAIAPLLGTPLWSTIPVERSALGVVALPEILRALRPWRAGGAGSGRELALIADPLGWPSERTDRWTVPTQSIGEGRIVAGPPGGPDTVCPVVVDVGRTFFDPPADELEGSEAWASVVGGALARDRCALVLALTAVRAGYDVVHVRLEGHGEVAKNFAGFSERSPARGVSQREVDAYGRVLSRYLRALDPDLGSLFEELDDSGVVALVSPHGMESRQDLQQLIERIAGLRRATGSVEAAPPGVLVLAGSGLAGGEHASREHPLASVLPTLMFAAELPVAADMGPIIGEAFSDEFLDERQVVTIPSYTATRTADRGRVAADERGER